MGICYTEKQVAKILGLPAKTLRNHRSTGKGIPYVKIGEAVRYRKKDVDACLKATLQAPEGYVRPEPQKANSEALLNPGGAEQDSLTADMPTPTDWKVQLLDAMLLNGVITKRFTGEVSFKIENGRFKAVLKQEVL